MGDSQFQNAVLATTICAGLLFILNHELRHRIRAADNVFEDPSWRNYTLSRNSTFLVEHLLDILTANGQVNAAQAKSITATINATISLDEGASLDAPLSRTTFYFEDLPATLFRCAILVPFQYYWNTTLEASFPVRPKRQDLPSNSSGDDAHKHLPFLDEKGVYNEKAVQRWIERGESAKRKFSLRNTLIQWILVIGGSTLIFDAFYALLDSLVLNGEPLSTGTILGNPLAELWSTIWSWNSIFSLIGIIYVPAHHRVVLEACIPLLSTVSWHLFLVFLAPWVMQTNFIQTQLQSQTEAIWEQTKLAIQFQLFRETMDV